MLLVFNKMDRVSPEEAQRLRALAPSAIPMSAQTGAGVDALREEIAARLALETQRVTLEFDEEDETDRQRIARLYRHARVRSHHATEGRVSIEADVPRRWLGRLTAVPAR
jgi:50S ribosomal subunit-associated GTPase HflX